MATTIATNHAVSSALVFTTSPNWYGAHSMVWLDVIPEKNEGVDSIVVYIARADVIFIDVSNMRFLRQFPTGGGRLLAVSAFVDRNNGDTCVVTGAANGKVCWWRPVNSVYTMYSCRTLEAVAINALDTWIDANRVVHTVCGCENGRMVVVANSDDDSTPAKVYQSNDVRAAIVCVRVNANHTMIAKGYDSGNIVIHSISSECDIVCMQPLQASITQLWWQPTTNADTDNPAYHSVVSACKAGGGMIHKWSWSSSWSSNDYVKPACTIMVPVDKNKKKPQQCWVTVLSPTSKQSGNNADGSCRVYGTGGGGDMYQWDIEANAAVSAARKVRALHTRSVFGLLASESSAYNHCVVSHSMDRTISVYNYATKRLLGKFTTLGGCVHALAASTTDNDAGKCVVAMGCNDKRIHLLEFVDDSMPLQTKVLWNSIGEAVKLIEWHPSIANVLVYVSSCGKIRIYNTRHQRQWTQRDDYMAVDDESVSEEMATAIKRAGRMVSVCWHQSGLYSCDHKGVVYTHHISIDDSGAVQKWRVHNVVYPSPLYSTESVVPWPRFCTPNAIRVYDNDHVIAAHNDGGVVVYDVRNDCWSVRCGVHDFLAPVSCMAVNTPMVAVGNDAGVVCVYDFTVSMAGTVGVISVAQLRHQVGRHYQLHDNADSVTVVQWFDHYLISGTSTGHMVVLDTQRQCVLAEWSAASSSGAQLVCACCVPIGTKATSLSLRVLCSFDNQTVHSYDIVTDASANHGHSPQICADPAAIVSSSSSVARNDEKTSSSEEPKRKKQKAAAFMEWNTATTTITSIVPEVDSNTNNDDWWIQQCMRVHSADDDGDGGAPATSSSLLPCVNPASLSAPVDTVLAVWQGGLCARVCDAMENRTLNADLVALSGGLGREMWLRVVVRYARQLEQAGDYQRGALYYLSGHQYPNAVACLVRGGRIVDAAQLSLIRLGAQHAYTRHCFAVAGRQCELRRSFAEAALYYMHGERVDLAVNSLLRSTLQDDDDEAATAVRHLCEQWEHGKPVEYTRI